MSRIPRDTVGPRHCGGSSARSLEQLVEHAPLARRRHAVAELDKPQLLSLPAAFPAPLAVASAALWRLAVAVEVGRQRKTQQQLAVAWCAAHDADGRQAAREGHPRVAARALVGAAERRPLARARDGDDVSLAQLLRLVTQDRIVPARPVGHVDELFGLPGDHSRASPPNLGALLPEARAVPWVETLPHTAAHSQTRRAVEWRAHSPLPRSRSGRVSRLPSSRAPAQPNSTTRGAPSPAGTCSWSCCPAVATALLSARAATPCVQPGAENFRWPGRQERTRAAWASHPSQQAAQSRLGRWSLHETR
eukprot:5334436-Pleurochrysis_carterae.AAC.1